MWQSLRGRFAVAALSLIAVVLGMAWYAQHHVGATWSDSQDLISQYYGTHKYLEDAKDALRELEAELYPYALQGGELHTGKLEDRLSRLETLDRHLSGNELVDGIKELSTTLTQILSRLRSDFSALGESGAGGAASDLWEEERLALVREHLGPGLRSAYKLIHLVERRLYDAVLGKTFRSLDTSELVSRLSRGAAVAVCLVIAVGYLAFELSIRRPLLKVARALEAEGRGNTAAPPLPHFYTRETAMLVAAFDGMRRQVRSRQLRLESVLHNTSDGIITFDGQGRIEAFNAAAVALFGYDEDDVVGEPLHILLAGTAEQAAAANEAFSPRAQPRETFVVARRKDGVRFDLSCKVSEFSINGRPLFNAMVADVSERKAMLDHLTYLAERDPLTALYNRRYFLEELARITERAKRGKGNPAALLVLDLDHFKFVNDKLGHQAGDQLLIEIAARLRERGRKGDLPARLGGDEFAVLVFDVDPREAEIVAESYCRTLSDYPFKYMGKAIEIGCSIGVALLAGDAPGKQDILARADLACRIAKQRGRNCYHFYQAEDERSTARLSATIGHTRLIRKALAENRLMLAFQVIVDVSSGHTSLHEVLVRLRQEDGSLLSAQGFVTEAERLGLAPEIDRWVVENAFAAIHAGHVPAPAGRYSINISGQSIGEPLLARTIADGLEHYRVDPRRIVFELTETAAVTSLEQAKEFIGWLRRLGCQTALDDFGAGYASFAYLRELATDYVKLDGSLVRNIDTDRLNLAVVKAMNDVAQTLGRKTIAEFVENQTIVEKLRAIGVDYAQGYHFGRPELFEPGRHEPVPCMGCPRLGLPGTALPMAALPMAVLPMEVA